VALRFQDERFLAVILELRAILNRYLPRRRRAVRTQQLTQFRAKPALPFAASVRSSAAKPHFEWCIRRKFADVVVNGRAALQLLGASKSGCQQ
jgi:hypothetical protein